MAAWAQLGLGPGQGQAAAMTIMAVMVVASSGDQQGGDYQEYMSQYADDWHGIDNLCMKRFRRYGDDLGCAAGDRGKP